MVIGEMALLEKHALALTIVVFRDDTLSLIKLKQSACSSETGVEREAPTMRCSPKRSGSGVGVQDLSPAAAPRQAALRRTASH